MGSYYLIYNPSIDMYLYAGGWGPSFTPDFDEARRFSSREEAQQYINRNLSTFNVTIEEL